MAADKTNIQDISLPTNVANIRWSYILRNEYFVVTRYLPFKLTLVKQKSKWTLARWAFASFSMFAVIVRDRVGPVAQYAY